MQLSWYVRRLSLMSFPELLYRAVRTTGTMVGRLRFTLGLLPDRPAAVPLDVAWYRSLVPRDTIRAEVLRRFSWTPDAADRLLAHRFTFLSFVDRDFGSPLRWNYDYLDGIATPMGYGPSIDYRDQSRCGDIKHVWELNRHLHLVELAKASYLTGDPRYAQEVLTQLDSWLRDCPWPVGVQWSSNLELAIRLINWCFTYQFLRATPGDPLGAHPDLHARWLASIGDHLRVLHGHRSRYSSANNHLIGEVVGLLIGRLCFALPKSEGWVEEGRAVLEKEAVTQHWPDGANKEQALRYHASVLEFLLLAGVLGTRNGLPFSQQYWQVVDRSCDFLALHYGLGRPLPLWGDDDEGRTVILGASRDDYAAVLGTAAALLGRKDLLPTGAPAVEHAYWIVGDPSPVPPSRRSLPADPDFPQAGIHFLRAADTTVLFDCGPLGYLSLAAHGHADALSVLLYVAGRGLLVDPGTYAYHTHRVWRNHFRGTFAHNTLRVDGQDQSEIGGAFMWLRKANAALLHRDARSISGWHDGYLRLPDPVRHERRVELAPDGRTVLLRDSVDAAGTHTLDLTLTFAPDCRCRVEGTTVVADSGDITVRIVGDTRLGAPRLLVGSEDPRGGWFGLGLDRKIPTTTAWWQLRSTGSVTLCTTIQLS